MVWEEAAIVAARINGQIASEAVLIQMAISTMFSPQAAKKFTKLTSDLSEG